MINIEKHSIFIEEAYSFMMPNHEHWSKEIKNIILVEENKDIHKHSTVLDEACNVKAKRTPWDSHYRYPAVLSLTKDLIKIVEDFIKKEDFDAPLIKIEECWLNWYNKDNYTTPHNHGVHLSLVYFIDVEDTGAKFLFSKNNCYSLEKKEKNHTRCNNVREVNVKNGTVLMFNGNLTHGVTPNLSDQTRITYAANLVVQYMEKREDY